MNSFHPYELKLMDPSYSYDTQIPENNSVKKALGVAIGSLAIGLIFTLSIFKSRHDEQAVNSSQSRSAVLLNGPQVLDSFYSHSAEVAFEEIVKFPYNEQARQHNFTYTIRGYSI